MKKKLLSTVILFQIFALSLSAQTDTVSIYNMVFTPATLTISAGKKVVWINKSNTDHTSTSGIDCAKDGKWNSGYLSEGQSFSYIFNAEGVYNYFCIPHCLSGMKGIIVVKGVENPPKENEALKKKENKEPNQEINSQENKKNNEELQQENKKAGKPAPPNFKGLDIINAVTTKTLDKGILDFTIYHRFDDLIGNKGGPQVFFGLDNIRDVRLALAYGLVKNITIGIGRSKGDWFNAPYQEVKNLYDGSIKIRVCSQDTGTKKFPFSIAVYANTVYTAMKSQDMPESEANFKHFTDRFSHSCQIIMAHNFSKYLSFQLMPVYLRRNWVNICPDMSTDELDIFSLGGGARWGFSNRFALVAEYFYVFSEYRKKNKDVFSNPLAVGVEINTGAHVFHINLSNATGIIPNTFIPYTTSSWLKNGFRLGFSISRKFILNKKSGMTKQTA